MTITWLLLNKLALSLRDARFWNNNYLDIFIYNEKDVIIVDSSFLRILGGVVLQREGFGQNLLKQVDEFFATGPAALSANEIQLRRTWCYKMLKRISQRDIEADYRRVWLLYTLLEDYFALRQKWYLGSKESWKWLKTYEHRYLHGFWSGSQAWSALFGYWVFGEKSDSSKPRLKEKTSQLPILNFQFPISRFRDIPPWWEPFQFGYPAMDGGMITEF